MSWLGGPLPGTGEKMGLDPTPKFDPNYGDLYDQGGWTETIIGPDMSEEIYRGTNGDSRWNTDINGGVANVDEWLKMIEDKSKENQFLDTQKSNIGIGSPQSQQMFQQVSPKVTLTRDGTPFNPYGSAAQYGAMRMAAQNPSLSQTLGAGVQSAAMNMVLGAIPGVGPALAAANALGVDIPGVLKGGARMAGDAFGGIAKGVGGLFKGIGKIFCDERLKVDIAPLESTEVNDELAQMAFFVKGLRECS